MKKHDAYERLMRTTVPDKKVTGNKRTYIKSKRQGERVVTQSSMNIPAEVSTRTAFGSKTTGRYDIQKVRVSEFLNDNVFLK